MVTYVDPYEEFTCETFTCNNDQAYVLLTDEYGFIQNTTSNFYDTFLLNQDINFVEDKVNIEEVFIGLADYTDEELARGIQTQINQSFIFK